MITKNTLQNLKDLKEYIDLLGNDKMVQTIDSIIKDIGENNNENT